MPTHSRDALASADTVIVCGMPDHEVMRTGRLDPTITAALDLAPDGARWISICTGAFVLAARGLLDGRTATTHWVHADRFRAVFPHLDLDPHQLYVDNGDVMTSAGNAAGIDLLLHVIRKDLGVSVANRVARGCVVAPLRSGGQSQFIDHPVRAADDASTADLQRYVLDHLDQPLRLEQLARDAHLSVRSLTRRFREETGQTVGEWIAAARVERAQHLLETTADTVDKVAAAVGFGTSAALRQHFRAKVGVSPATYRRTFRAERGA
jgi:transcriptional regulator GlxA family with amidase domain